MLMGVTGRGRCLCGQRKSRLRTESIIVATSRSKPGATPILRPDDHAVDALPFAHIWPTRLPRRRVLINPSMLQHEHHSPDRGDVAERVAVHGQNLRLLPLASEPIRSAIPSDSAATDVPLSNASMGLSPPSRTR